MDLPFQGRVLGPVHLQCQVRSLSFLSLESFVTVVPSKSSPFSPSQYSLADRKRKSGERDGASPSDSTDGL